MPRSKTPIVSLEEAKSRFEAWRQKKYAECSNAVVQISLVQQTAAPDVSQPSIACRVTALFCAVASPLRFRDI